jgi:hypothetical protein
VTIPGLGGQTPPRADQQYAGQAGVPIGPGSPNVVRARQVIISGPGEELLVYSGAPALGNLLFSVTNLTVPGTDELGNHIVPLTGWYDNAGGFFTQIGAGFITFGTGSLAAGWTANASIQNDGSGNLNINATGSVLINGSANTGAGSNGGVTSGPSGTVNAFPAAGPNHTHAEVHTHTL